MLCASTVCFLLPAPRLETLGLTLNMYCSPVLSLSGALSWDVLYPGSQRKKAVFVANDQKKEAGTACPFSCGEHVVHLCLGWKGETVKRERKEMGAHIGSGSVQGGRHT